MRHQMEFSREYFDDEVRDGFYVNGMMKRCWGAQVEVLSEVAKLCERHGIRWFADCGTLLGAVRHGGFIPWDDDLDICMFRADYDRFQEIAKKELPEGYVIRDYHDKDCWDLLLRINNRAYLNFSEEELEKYHGFPFIAGIDIFPLDYVPEDPKEAETWRTIGQHIFFLTAREDLEMGSRMSAETRMLLRKTEQLLKKKLNWNKPIKVQLYDMMTEVFSVYKNSKGKDVVLTPYWLHEGSHRYAARWFQHAVDIPFETGTIRAPYLYDAVLRTEYGAGYMTPVHAGGVHGYPHYEEQEQLLKDENNGFYPFWYTFSEEQAEESKQTMGKKPREQAERFLTVLRDAGNEVKKEVASGETKDAVTLLEQAQGLAIQLGELIEKNEGEGTQTVKRLEEYCEAAFLLHEALESQENENINELLGKLTDSLEATGECLDKEIEIRREIVFLPWKSSMWSTMEPTYRKWKEDPSCRVTVIPLPYYEKKPDNSFGALFCDADQFPEDVPVTHYENYDFAACQPDMIYIQNPYDECNYTSSIHPFFFAKNLKQYTEQLIYIPWFKTAEIEAGDERSKKSMEHYASVPGVVYADQVVVQSGRMRSTYIDFLTDWAGENTKQKWENKIVSEETAAEKGIYCSSSGSPQEKRDRKTILYYTSASILLEHGKSALDKMREVFKIFRDQREQVELLWWRDPLIETVVKEDDPALYEEYRAITETFEKDRIGRYADNLDESALVSECDAYYGDPGSIIRRFLLAGLPVMIQDVEVR